MVLGVTGSYHRQNSLEIEMGKGNVHDSNLVWMDLEMTGLSPERDVIIEIATVVTDAELNIVAEGPELAIRQPKAVMDGMDEWCTHHHGKSGLTDRVLASNTSVREAELQTIAFLKKHVQAKQSPLCGNTIGQDRRFLARYMPQLERFLHYRNLDVSTLKELAVRWHPDVAQGFHKSGAHLALQDILESIEELRYYRDNFIR